MQVDPVRKLLVCVLRKSEVSLPVGIDYHLTRHFDFWSLGGQQNQIEFELRVLHKSRAGGFCGLRENSLSSCFWHHR